MIARSHMEPVEHLNTRTRLVAYWGLVENKRLDHVGIEFPYFLLTARKLNGDIWHVTMGT